MIRTWVVLLAVGCKGDDDGTDTGPADPPTSETGTVADSLFASPPAWRDNTDGALLVGFVDLTTTEATTVSITIDDGVGVRTIDDPVSGTTHSVRILGLRPDTVHELTVTATGTRAESAPLTVTVGPLPPDFPVVQVLTADKARMEPGVTFTVIGSYLEMFDADGVAAWYMPSPAEHIHQVAYTDRDTLLVHVERTLIMEITLTGAVVRQWRSQRTPLPADAIEIAAYALHHDVFELPNGNFLGLSVESRLLPDYPQSEIDPDVPHAEANVAGDIVLEFQPDGTLVHAWPLFDRLDPYRIGYDGLKGDYWEGFFPGDIKDWTHANAIWYDPVRDEVVVSLRHQDAVIGLNHTTGDVEWIFAPEENWPVELQPKLFQPVNPAEIRPYHQHGAKLSPEGTLMMFDNGNNRSSPFAPVLGTDDNFSRGIEIALDHTTNTWTVVWQFGQGLDPNRFSGSQGDCDPLPLTGNRLVVFGNIKNPVVPGVELFEVTSGPNPEVVWDFVTPDQGAGIRPNTYRAERLTDVIPGR